MKLAAKMITLVTLGFVVLILINGYLSYRREVALFGRDWHRDAKEHVGDLRDFLLYICRRDGEAKAMEWIQRINDRGRLEVRIVWLGATPGDREHAPLAPVKLASLVSQKDTDVQTYDHSDPSGGRIHLAYAQIQDWSDRSAALEMREGSREVRVAFRAFATRTLLLAATTLVLGGVFVAVLGNELFKKPLGKIIEKTRRIGRGDLSGPLVLRRWDEFGELAAALNSMCEQLEEAQRKAKQETEARITATDQLRHAERLQTIGRLAAGIAHELGTPLNVVSGRAGLIASGKLAREQIQENAEIIKTETNRIAKIIHQLLDFASRKPAHKRPSDLRQLVKQLLELLDPLAEKRNYTVTVANDSGPIMANVDASQFQQVMTNLLLNAAQSMSGGGRIDVGFRPVSLRPPGDFNAPPREYVAVSVRDEGSGIPEKDIRHIFEPFFTTKEVGQGTGLGLSVSFGIVQEHGGWIDVESDVGKGSCFTVYLPAEGDECQDAS